MTHFDDADVGAVRIDLLDVDGEVPRAIEYPSELAPDSWSTRLTREIKNFELFPDTQMTCLVLNLINFPPARIVDRRESFQVGDWTITLHDRCDYDDFRVLKKATGYLFTVACRIDRSDGREFSRSRADRVISDLWHALSFARGAEVGMALEVGFDSCGNRVYAKWGATLCEPWRNCYTWFDPNSLGGVEKVANYLHSADTDTRLITERWIKFFLAGNHPRPAEVGLIVSFAGLESLIWWKLHGHGDWIIDKSVAESMPAASRVRLLLKWAKIPTEVPAGLTHLAAEVQSGKRGAPEVVASVRNAITHTTDLKRIPDDELVIDAWLLASWYLELSILAVSGYTGQYSNRLRPGRYVGHVDDVPWSDVGK